MNAELVLIVAVVVPVASTFLRWQSVGDADDVQAARLHGEQVFRLQSAVVSQLIDAGESDANYSPRKSAGGGGPDLPLQLRVLASLDACEDSALTDGQRRGRTARSAALVLHRPGPGYHTRHGFRCR